ncbi:MORN repeat protein [Balamuthia mandrillaris]
MEISSAMMQHSFAKQALEAGTYESLPLPTSLPLDSLSSFSNTSPTNSSYLPQPNSPTSALPPDIGGVPLPDDPSAGPPSPLSHARAQSQYGTSSPLAGTPGYTSDSSSHFGTMRRTNSGGPRPRVALFNADNSELGPRDLRAKEIYTTELTYCGILDVIIEDFMQPATKKNVFSPQEYRTIFSNIESIRNFNKDLLAAIRVQMADWTSETTIGDIFLKKIPFLKIYTTYCNNHSSANQLLEKIQSRKNVAQFLKECQKKDLDLNALLITPVQRIPRYQLLLKELISFTEESHPDYANLKSALEQIKKIADEINDAVLRSDSTKEVHTLSKMIPGIQKLLTGSRQLVKHGPVDVTSAEAKYSYLLLFSDVLVFASPMPKGKKLELREKLQLEHVWADDMKDTTSAETAWQLVSPESTYLVQSPNKEDKIIWVDKCHQRTLACCERLGIVDDAMPLGKRKMEYTFRNAAVYSGEWFNGKMHGQGTFTSPDSTTYEGGYANGKFEGHGKITYLTSESYEGQWLKGKPHGEGTLKLLTGTYTGTWENGNQCGQGKVVYSSGDSYEGGFKDNLREGKGVLRGADGSVYEGDWKADKQCGKGKLKNHLGTYEGGWLNDQRNGQGTMTYNNGDKFEGTWSDDRRNGKGTLTSADGTFQYDGEWKDDLMEGQGTLIINQTKYEGMLKAGKRYGEGTYTTPTGTYSGNWADDRREGKGKWVRTDGSVYEGEWHSDLRFGKGTQIDPDGSRYDGKWVKGRREGSGVQTYPNGSKYSGSWARDRRHGQGVFATANDAAKYVGDWVYDNREGSGVMTDSSGTYDGAWKNDMRNGAGVFKYANGMVFTGEWQNDKRHGMGQLTFPDGKRPPIQVQYESGVLVSPAFAELPPDLGLSRALFKA